VGWTAWGSNPGRGKIFFPSSECPDWVWGPPALCSVGTRVLS